MQCIGEVANSMQGLIDTDNAFYAKYGVTKEEMYAWNHQMGSIGGEHGQGTDFYNREYAIQKEFCGY